MRRAVVLLLSCVAMTIAAPAQTLTTLASFNGSNGGTPASPLVQGTDGNFYGTTVYGGANSACPYSSGCGTVFRITPAGIVTTLHSFCSAPDCSDGIYPSAGLIQATNGNFYGTTSGTGDTGERQTAFKITSGGVLTTLHTFCANYPNCGVEGVAPNWAGARE